MTRLIIVNNITPIRSALVWEIPTREQIQALCPRNIIPLHQVPKGYQITKIREDHED